MKQKALVVGIGNQLRQDDGLGPYCVDLMKETRSRVKDKLVDYLVVHQLDVIHSEIFAKYQFIIFIDADAQKGPDPFRVEEITPEPKSRAFTTHIGSSSDILSLTKSLYGVVPKAYLVAVRGSSFEAGDSLSLTAIKNAKKALVFIEELTHQFFPLE